MTNKQAATLGRRHYVMVASLIKMIRDDKDRREICRDFIASYGCLNERFDRERFKAACNVAY